MIMMSTNKTYYDINLSTIVYGAAGVILLAAGLIYQSIKKRNILLTQTQEEEDIKGKICIITGSNTGIGKYTALQLAKRGANIILACRNVAKGEEAKLDILQQDLSVYSDRLIVMECDLSSFASVAKFSRNILSVQPALHFLINNAGVYHSNVSSRKTFDGYEETLQVNYLGAFVLTHMLLPLLKSSGTTSSPSRIINLSSRLEARSNLTVDTLINHFSSPYVSSSYADSKLLVTSSTRHIAKLLPSNILCVACTPGLVASDMSRHMLWYERLFYIPLRLLLMRNIEKGSEVVIWLASVKKEYIETGKYYSDCKELEGSKMSRDKEFAEFLYQHTLKIFGLAPAK